MKIKKRILMLLMSFSILILNNSIIYASQECRHDVNTIEDIEMLFNIDIDYETYKVLYNGNEDIIAVAYKVNTDGYIVIDKTYSEVVEYNSNENNFFDFDDSIKIYYNGPLSFYRYSTDLICTDVYGNVVEKCEICFEPQRNITNLNSTMMLSSYPDEAYLSYATAAYSYNPDGRCGAVAAAITLKYYDTYYNSGYIPSSLDSSTGVTLINKLTNDYLGTGTSYTTMASGLSSYLSDVSMSASAVSKSALFTDVWGKTVEYINGNKPVILLLQEDPTYENHYVVATGYHEYYSNGLTRMYRVNNGWGSTEANVNDNYVFAITYLN